jgi:hypothetical protein
MGRAACLHPSVSQAYDYSPSWLNHESIPGQGGRPLLPPGALSGSVGLLESLCQSCLLADHWAFECPDAEPTSQRKMWVGRVCSGYHHCTVHCAACRRTLMSAGQLQPLERHVDTESVA